VSVTDAHFAPAELNLSHADHWLERFEQSPAQARQLSQERAQHSRKSRILGRATSNCRTQGSGQAARHLAGRSPVSVPRPFQRAAEQNILLERADFML
jgi:hypothetical protein